MRLWTNTQKNRGQLNKLGKTRIYSVAQKTPFSCGKQLAHAGFGFSHLFT